MNNFAKAYDIGVDPGEPLSVKTNKYSIFFFKTINMLKSFSCGF